MKGQIDKARLPEHIAIIMDGNGRWAKQKGMLRVFGHENGVKAVKETVEGCAEIGIKALTLYAFSTENWNRPRIEVNKLMSLLVNSLTKELPSLEKNQIKLNAIGNLNDLPEKTKNKLYQVIEHTKDNNHMTLTIALSYGAKEELTNMVKEVAKKVKNNLIRVENIDSSIINKHLYTHDLPEVDLLIRTSGEQRVSNFLLWQIAYAEMYFTPILWPDFTKVELFKAIIDYQNRERRFGKTSEQIK